MRKQLPKTFLDIGGRDERFTILIGDISHFLLREFQANYPDRFYNMGVAEQSMIGIAAGMAMNGMIPVVHTIAPFITERCLEQIKDDLCYQKLGVNLVTIGAAFDYAALGSTHHCYDDFAILLAQPEMQVISLGASHEFDALFKETYSNGSPTYFRLSEHEHGITTTPRFGEVEKLRDGADVTLAVIGPQLKQTLEAAEEVAREGVACDVLYFTTLKPLSDMAKKAIVDSMWKTEKLVTIEEHSVVGGLGDVIGLIAGMVPYHAKRVGIKDKFLINYGSYEEHCRANGLTAEGILEAIHEIQ